MQEHFLRNVAFAFLLHCRSLANISDFAAYAVAMDRQDELAHFRTRFVIDDPDLIYLDGNSLGRLPLASADRLTQMVPNEWATD